jgi:predicted nucleic acid-binding Zn ribbon protein
MSWDDADDDDYSGFDTSDPDEDATVPCPACGAEIYDDAERCPECGHYQTREEASRAKTPLWIIVGAIICLAIVALWIIGGM